MPVHCCRRCQVHRHTAQATQLDRGRRLQQKRSRPGSQPFAASQPGARSAHAYAPVLLISARSASARAALAAPGSRSRGRHPGCLPQHEAAAGTLLCTRLCLDTHTHTPLIFAAPSSLQARHKRCHGCVCNLHACTPTLAAPQPCCSVQKRSDNAQDRMHARMHAPLLAAASWASKQQPHSSTHHRHTIQDKATAKGPDDAVSKPPARRTHARTRVLPCMQPAALLLCTAHTRDQIKARRPCAACQCACTHVAQPQHQHSSSKQDA